MGKRESGISNIALDALRDVVRFYYDGFRSMTVGRTLWVIILVKLFIMFGILRVFFFPDLLQRDYNNDEERAEHVRRQLIRDAMPVSPTLNLL